MDQPVRSLIRRVTAKAAKTMLRWASIHSRCGRRWGGLAGHVWMFGGSSRCARAGCRSRSPILVLASAMLVTWPLIPTNARALVPSAIHLLSTAVTVMSRQRVSGASATTAFSAWRHLLGDSTQGAGAAVGAVSALDDSVVALVSGPGGPGPG
jgi:hypothetical protein